MRCLLQRVTQASVSVDNEVIGQISNGLLILACSMEGDTEKNTSLMAKKVANLRIFKDSDGRMNRSIMDTGGSTLVISQFTLAADTSRGNRPGFSAAAAPDLGERLYNQLCADIVALNIPVQRGKFGADMAVSLINDGPVTISLER